MTLTKNNAACVYWIKHPKHTDMLSEGYIGFTSQQFNLRMLHHQGAARNNRPETICRAIRKYGWENLEKKILVIGSPEYCLDVEKKLRPKENIGWNIGIGGGAAFLGMKHTPEARKRMSQSMRGIPKSAQAKINIGLAAKGRVPTAEARANMSTAGKVRVAKYGFPEQHCERISAAKKGIATAPLKWRRPTANKNLWLNAERIYEIHLMKLGKIPYSLYPAGITNDSMCRMREHFRKGWNPKTDSEFQEWLKSQI